MSAILVFFHKVIQVEFTSQVMNFPLIPFAFFLNERKPRFIYVGVNVNARSSKAILVESTESH